jgi:hypothetical protein
MTTLHRNALRAGALATFLIALASSALAQTTVRVTLDKAKIWTPDFRTAAAVVDTGAVLTVVGQRSEWYEVLVPGTDSAVQPARGFIYKGHVSNASGPVPFTEERPGVSAGSPSASPSVGFAGFIQFGYARFAARESFQAVLGQAGGAFAGGGGEVRWGPGLFLNASAEHFTKTGERVVVFEGQVFRMGLADTITLTPVNVTAGWRFVHERATPYVGGGIGKIGYREETAFSDESETLNARFTSYHVVAGLEFRNGWVASAFEVQYTHAPDTFGKGGASLAFHESNLGGLAGRVKILVGR